MFVKIKEIEEKSGMTRANIRFYETEGLLAPVRDSNGYRVYTEQELEILQRIKLLRTLQVPLEEIKKLHCGQQQLQALLEQHLLKLEHEKEQLDQSQRICQLMLEDGVQYGTMDAQHYLIALEQLQQEKPTWQMDMGPQLKAPVRRLFARAFDILCYATIVLMIQALSTEPFLFIEDNIVRLFVVTECYFIHLLEWASLYPWWLWSNILFIGSDTVLYVLLLMLFLEPAMLAKFGTTPGKWLLGLSVQDYEEQKLDYEAALKRTWQVLWYGWGLNIPFYRLIRLGKSFLLCDRGETQRWEQETVQVLQDDYKWRIALYSCCLTMISALVLWLMYSHSMKLNGFFHLF